MKCSVEEKFVDKWEITRNKQNQWRLKEAEDFYKKNVDVLKVKSVWEDRATHEMQTYLRDAIMVKAFLSKILSTWQKICQKIDFMVLFYFSEKKFF